jgi:hypothetical protein
MSLLMRDTSILSCGSLEKHSFVVSTTREWLCEGKVEERSFRTGR